MSIEAIILLTAAAALFGFPLWYHLFTSRKGSDSEDTSESGEKRVKGGSRDSSEADSRRQ